MDYKTTLNYDIIRCKLKIIERNAYGYHIGGKTMGIKTSRFEKIMRDAVQVISDLLIENQELLNDKKKAEAEVEKLRNEHLKIQYGGEELTVQEICERLREKEWLDEIISGCERMIQDSWNSGTAPVSWAEAYATFVDDIEVQDTIPAPQWIRVEDRMPIEHESMFKKFKGTSKWLAGMHETISDDVNVVVKFEDGTKKVYTSHTTDGVWRNLPIAGKPVVTHWMPLPEPPKED